MTDSPTPETTDFGFQKVRVEEKARKVAAVFSSVARRYDVMNDVMSAGLHRLWKRFAVELLALRPGQRVLDLAAGTGDLSALMAPRIGATGQLIASDINAAMLREGRQRLTNDGIVGNIGYVLADAEKLPFCDDYFDAVTIAFGLRNVTHKDRALREMCRVLRPGGQLLVLEFSKVTPALAPLYDAYSFNVLPRVGQLIAGDADSYRYLAESIRMHPDQAQMKQMIEQAGFVRADFYNLTAGVVAIHRGFKP